MRSPLWRVPMIWAVIVLLAGCTEGSTQPQPSQAAPGPGENGLWFAGRDGVAA